MYKVKVTDRFCAAHRLNDYNGQCENLHGHNWKVKVVLSGEKLQKNGILVDFTVLKAALKETLDILDHKFLNDIPELKGVNPTSENLARSIFELLAGRGDFDGAELVQVSVWESENAWATYLP